MYIYPTETNNQPRDLTMTSSTQETIYIHLTLKDDLAYNWSVEHNDAEHADGFEGIQRVFQY